MASNYMKRHSTSLVIMEIEVKTTTTYHCTPIRMAIWKRKITSVGRNVKWFSRFRNSLAVPQKVTGKVNINSIPRYKLKRNEKRMFIQKLVHRCNIIIIQVETTQTSRNWWMDKKKCAIFITMEYYSAIKGIKYWHLLQHNEPWKH